MAFRIGSLERASTETGIMATLVVDSDGLFARVTLDELPDDPKRRMAQTNLFLHRADQIFDLELQQEVVARMLS